MTADLGDIAASLRSAFPEVAFENLSVLGTGFDSVAVETDSGFVFRIGTTSDAARGYVMEARFLPALAPHVPAPIPQPRWYAPAGDPFPFGAIGYPKLTGDTLMPALAEGRDTSRLEGELADFLLAMHRYPIDEALACGVRVYDADLALLRENVTPAMHERLRPADAAALVRWWDAVLADSALRTFVPVVRHNDLWHENTLVHLDPLQLAGVLDFGDVSIGDPAREFAAFTYLGDAFGAGVIERYGAGGGDVSPAMRHRIGRYRELREFFGLRWAIRNKAGFELEDAAKKVAANFGFSVISLQ